MFTIKYSNSGDTEFKLNQFSMNLDEIKQFLDIVHETVYNPPKFKKMYKIGDKFIIPSMTVVEENSSYRKEIIYKNVEAVLIDIFTFDKQEGYVLDFDGNTIVETEESLIKLKRCV